MTEAADFSYLSEYEIDAGRVVEFIFHELRGAPSIMVAPATQENKGYTKALVARNQMRGRGRQGQSAILKTIDEDRAEDRILYPKHIVKGWGSRPPVDKQGNVPEFTEDNAAAFLGRLPAWIFDRLTLFCRNGNNFLAEDEPSDEEIDEAGNA